MLTAPQQRLVAEHAGLGGQATRHLRHEDRVGIGNLAVVEAAQRWDPTLGASFGTYARKRAQWAVADRRRIDARMSRANMQALHLIGTVNASECSDTEAAELAGLTVSKVREARAAKQAGLVLRLDEPSSDHNPATPADLAAPVPDHADTVTDRVALVAAVGRLGGRHRELIVLRFFAGWPHALIASRFGVTDTAVIHMQRTALGRLRDDIEQVFA